MTTAPSTHPPGDRARDLAGLVHRHRRAPGRGARALDAHDSGDRDPLPRRPPPLDVVQDLSHRERSPPRASSSEASEWPSTNSSTYGSAAAIPRASGANPGDRLQRVHPHHRCATRCRRAICSASVVGVATVPPVGQDHHDRAARQAAHPPLVVERAEPLAEPGAARPVDDASPPRPRRRRDRADRELAGDPGEAGAERERLDPAPADDRGVEEAHKRTRVRLHRAADVAEEHNAPRAGRWDTRNARANRLATGADRAAHGPAQVGVAPGPAAVRADGAGGCGGVRPRAGGRPSAGGPRRARPWCRGRSRGGAAPRPGSSAHSTQRASGTSARPSPVVGVVAGDVEARATTVGVVEARDRAMRHAPARTPRTRGRRRRCPRAGARAWPDRPSTPIRSSPTPTAASASREGQRAARRVDVEPARPQHPHERRRRSGRRRRAWSGQALRSNAVWTISDRRRACTRRAPGPRGT